MTLTPHLDDGDVKVYAGDCIDVMAALPAESVDAVCTDPPYALTFMGRGWDAYGPAEFQAWCEQWAAEALRVLKPGGHLLAFGGTRTFHRLTSGLEDAGFEIRDVLSYMFGSGFPKSLSPYRDQTRRLCQSIESAPHAVRLSEWLPLASPAEKGPIALALAEMLPAGDLAVLTRTGEADGSSVVTVTSSSVLATAGISLNTESSWSACSVVIFDGTNMSITETATRLTTDPRTLRFLESLPTPRFTHRSVTRPDGCSCDACHAVAGSSDGGMRWSDTPTLIAPGIATGGRVAPLRSLGSALKPGWEPIVLARKPLTGTVAANVQQHGTGALNISGCRIGTEGGGAACPGGDLCKCSTNKVFGATKHPPRDTTVQVGRWPANVVLDPDAARMLDDQAGDTGGPSRFFYTAKASTAERNNGHGPQNTHPTVKPVDLMRWCIRLITPPGGLVLDPFGGSGTTGVAARAEGMRCILIEREAEYLPIIAGRLSQLSLLGDVA